MEANSTTSDTNKKVINISKTNPAELILNGVAYLLQVIICCFARHTQLQTQELATADRGQGSEARL